MKILYSLLLLSVSFVAAAQKKIGINQKNPQYTLDVNGDIHGEKIYISEGVNASIGEAILVSGVVTVLTDKIKKNSKIFLSYKKAIFSNVDNSVLVAPDNLIIENKSFVIKSELTYPEPNNIANEGDNSIVYWWIIN